MQRIEEYLDYRDFLSDFYKEKKAQNLFYSYQVFAAHIGMDTSNLAKVIMKKRHIAAKLIPIVARYCGMTGRNAEYFELLVHFGKAKTDKQSRVYFEKLLSIKEAPSSTLFEKQYEYYTRWYYSAVRAIIEYFDFRGDYKLLGKQFNPPINARSAKKAVLLLEELELIKKDDTGRYRLTDKAITTGKQWHSAAIDVFQEETIGLALESLSRHPKNTRDISTITMAFNAEQFEEIKERIREFRASLIKYVIEGTSPDRVYHMNLQLVPLTIIPEREEQ
ncbi:MAG: TIGR02147 family protein [Chitinispirillaceae bacterium]|nr:TIGR02147 family protein [Chitinispirillaceae bacterium]